jgi:hypothetical protein
MRKAIIITIAVCLMLFSAGCQGGGGGEELITEEPFIGGTSGVVMSFAQNTPPEQVLDGGDFPFDIMLKLKNAGEFLVPKDSVRVSISGFEPGEFNVAATDLVKSPDEDLEPLKKDVDGNRIESPEVFVEFNNLNHVNPITGTQLTFPIKADVCYTYGTIATAALCVRENLVNPEAGGICEVSETKRVYNSGSPVQVTTMTESVRSRDKFAFSFTLSHIGNGNIYAQGSMCDKSSRIFQDAVNVEVMTGLPGLSCSGLGDAGATAGQVKLIGGSRQITCTQTVAAPADFITPVTINAWYDYEDDVTTQVIVKHAGE